MTELTKEGVGETRLRAEMQAAYDAAVQRVIDRFKGDVRAMAVEIVRLRDELMMSERTQAAPEVRVPRTPDEIAEHDERWRKLLAQLRVSAHRPVTTLEELDALDEAEMMAGFLSAEKGDPEPGANHSRSFYHGWRTRMMDLGEIPIPPEHRELTRQWVARMRSTR